MKGSGYLVLDGLDGRVHHHPVHDLGELGVRPGAVVEIAPSRAAPGKSPASATGIGPMSVFVRSDLPLEAQVSAEGATWLDGRLMHSARTAPNPGFGSAVEAALNARIDHLARQGLARRSGDKTLFARDLLSTLRDRELKSAGRALVAETGLPHRPAVEGDGVAGIYRKRLNLASGRFAMIDDGLGFTLVPWRPALERRLGQSVSGTIGPGQSINWSVARARGPAR